jgi:hydrogenase maturation factor
MHDPTEGGIATGLWELAEASGVGLHIATEQLPLLAEGAALCQAVGLDPLGTIASGALLAAVPGAQAAPAIAACRRQGIACYHIGTAVAEPCERLLHTPSGTRPLPTFQQDEIVKLFQKTSA